MSHIGNFTVSPGFHDSNPWPIRCCLYANPYINFVVLNEVILYLVVILNDVLIKSMSNRGDNVPSRPWNQESGCYWRHITFPSFGEHFKSRKKCWAFELEHSSRWLVIMGNLLYVEFIQVLEEKGVHYSQHYFLFTTIFFFKSALKYFFIVEGLSEITFLSSQSKGKICVHTIFFRLHL